MTRVVLSWSGGKDAAAALRELRRATDVEVVELLTTVSAEHDRVTMHGVRTSLLRHQADALGLPANVLRLPADATNEAYEEAMGDAVTDYRDRGVDRIAFADLFLEEVRAYREDRLAGTGVEGCWPVWGRDTGEFVVEFLDAGFRAIVVCVDGEALDESFVGRDFDRDFLRDLPDDVDPAGENGEFHTFVWDGPIFDEAVAVERGETVAREVSGKAFHYADLLSAER